MVGKLIVNWRRVEVGYMDFCLDYFDEKPMVLSGMGVAGESIEKINNTNSDILVFVERIFVAVLRYIFVKKYAVTEIVEDARKDIAKRVGILSAWSDTVVDFGNSIVCIISTKRLVLQVGFT